MFLWFPFNVNVGCECKLLLTEKECNQHWHTEKEKCFSVIALCFLFKLDGSSTLSWCCQASLITFI